MKTNGLLTLYVEYNVVLHNFISSELDTWNTNHDQNNTICTEKKEEEKRNICWLRVSSQAMFDLSFTYCCSYTW